MVDDYGNYEDAPLAPLMASDELEQPPSADVDEASAERLAFIQSLRDCAYFLERHPTVKVPCGGSTFNVFVMSKDELAAHARLASWEKCYEGDYFYLRKRFGVISWEVNANRSLVCRRVVTGTRVVPAKTEDVVEWVCDDTLAVLASASGAAATEPVKEGLVQ